jgi:hypothetical protein
MEIGFDFLRLNCRHCHTWGATLSAPIVHRCSFRSDVSWDTGAICQWQTCPIVKECSAQEERGEETGNQIAASAATNNVANHDAPQQYNLVCKHCAKWVGVYSQIVDGVTVYYCKMCKEEITLLRIPV